MSTRARKRWHVSYRAIYASRAMGSLIVSKTDCNENDNSQSVTSLLHSSSATASFAVDGSDISQLGIQDNSPQNIFVPNVDRQALMNIVKNKDMEALNELGGVEGVASSLGTIFDNGILDNDQYINKRRDMFGSNTCIEIPQKGFLYFVHDALKDITILILLALAALSFGFGFGIKHGKWTGWYDGLGIFIAVLIVVVCCALRDLKQEIEFHNLSKFSEDKKIEVIRGGRRKEISVFDVVVGDIVLLKIGDQVPADGLFINGHSLQVDESSITGESMPIQIDSTENPFLLSGSKVLDGYANMLVTSVVTNADSAGLMCPPSSCSSTNPTTLQDHLDKIASSVEKVGLIVAYVFLLVMGIRYFTGNTTDEDGNSEYHGSKTDAHEVVTGVVKFVATAVATTVVAGPKGLHMAFKLTLACFVKTMITDQAFIRNLSACETIGFATTICTDKTGILTMNQMKVVEFWLGQDLIVPSNNITPSVRELFYQGVAVNTTGSIYKPVSGSEPEFSGSPTEKAILSWASLELGLDMDKLKSDYKVLRVKTFNSEKKKSGVLLRKNVESTMYVHWKGAAEMVLEKCSSYHDSDGTVKSLDEDARSKIEKIIEGMAASSLRCIAFAHRQISEEEMEYTDDNKTQPKLKEDGLTLLGVVGLKDPCRPGVKQAVETCKSAGVAIKLITGDNIFTAKAIATECGILEPHDQQIDGEVIEGAEFRNYTDEQRMKKIDNIRVMARSSPSDKLLMVQCLKQRGHVVAATGDGINDAPTLLEANIGISMRIQGTEVAKQSSDAVIHDNFASIVKTVSWGRSIYSRIQNFIQFQLTVNVTALAINFFAAVSLGEIPFTAAQLLWVNLIMDILGALALLTERPSHDELMYKPPLPGQMEPLITSSMWRNILAQSVYQITILLILNFKDTIYFWEWLG
ncbi:calcium-transporting ATPase 12, plasma membrane-type-like isoform X2 [Humulus lupulus]|uniref:calcium-transporting ATPase 12, plasma membrane-type-like isoform X2 n=1 Tax=Humulus lupulus TaxID=3486 RepID=UPI002B413C36|nr:calcium-transporting ATPase 12, plasma membrane-type-like isoform X2 [Humulus lupulus]